MLCEPPTQVPESRRPLFGSTSNPTCGAEQCVCRTGRSTTPWHQQGTVLTLGLRSLLNHPNPNAQSSPAGEES
jgi:hypothetical protein